MTDRMKTYVVTANFHCSMDFRDIEAKDGNEARRIVHHRLCGDPVNYRERGCNVHYYLRDPVSWRVKEVEE